MVAEGHPAAGRPSDRPAGPSIASFQLGTSSMNSKVTGEGAAAADDDDVKKKHCNFRL